MCSWLPALIAVIGVPLMSREAASQLVTSPAANPIGAWRGTSRCVVDVSGCDAGIVIYQIAKGRTRDSLVVDGRRESNGRETRSDSLRCELNAGRALITCAIPDGKWRFRVRHDSLVGQLRLRDGTLLREVQAVRAPDRSPLTYTP